MTNSKIGKAVSANKIFTAPILAGPNVKPRLYGVSGYRRIADSRINKDTSEIFNDGSLRRFIVFPRSEIMIV